MMAKPAGDGDEVSRLLEEHLGDVQPSQAVCLTGAGVSANPPTNLPLGFGLTQRVFEQFFEPGALEVVLAYHEALGLRSPSPCASESTVRLPRLEMVLGVAARVHGTRRALRVLDDLRTARPNPLHAFFAGHLVQGGRHITANFDMYIEATLPANFDSSDVLWHFHGSVGSADTADSLGATLAAIEKGFDGDEEARLHQFLTAGDVLLVFGYSGSDLFDVDPAVAKLPSSALRGKRVLWFTDASVLSASRFPGRRRDPPLTSLLAEAGANVSIVCAPTASVCSHLATMWPPRLLLGKQPCRLCQLRQRPLSRTSRRPRPSNCSGNFACTARSPSVLTATAPISPPLIGGGHEPSCCGNKVGSRPRCEDGH